VDSIVEARTDLGPAMTPTPAGGFSAGLGRRVRRRPLEALATLSIRLAVTYLTANKSDMLYIRIAFATSNGTESIMPTEASVVVRLENDERNKVASTFVEYFKFKWTSNRRVARLNVERNDDYILAFVEFDDQGWYYDEAQRADLFECLKETSKDGCMIIVFIHGWKHNAASEDDNLKTFRDVLKEAHESEVSRSNAAKARPVVGVFIGWRGLSLCGNPIWTNLSFWTRKSVALRVAVGSVREVLSRLRSVQRAVNAASPDPSRRVELILAGHSFGALVLYTAIAEYLVEGAACAKVVRPFGDLVILINPAFEAARYQALHTAIVSRPNGFAPYQRPTFVSITAKNDLATRIAFPLGRLANTWFESVRKINQQGQPENAQKLAIRNTMGHLAWLVTHELEAQNTVVPQAQHVYRRGRTRSYQDEEVDFAQFNQQFRPGGHLSKGWVREYSSGARLRHVQGDPDNPFWNVIATPEIVDGHNGISKHIFIDCLRQLCDDRLRRVVGEPDTCERSI
jgi:hypothetical protein